MKLIYDGPESLIEIEGPYDSEIVIDGEVEFVSSGTITENTQTKKIVFSDKVQTIQEYAFNNCTALESVVIGKGIKEIGNHAFNKCKNLKTVEIKAKKNKVKIYAGSFPKKAEIFFGGVKPKTEEEKKRYNISLKELRKTCTVTSRNTGYSINAFEKDGRVIGPVVEGTKYVYKFGRNVTDKTIFIPDTVDKKAVGHVAVKTIPDDAVIICSAEMFGKLSKVQKASSAIGYLREPSLFYDDQINEIKEFMKRNPDSLTNGLKNCTTEQLAEYLSIAAPKAEVARQLVQILGNKPDLKAQVMEYQVKAGFKKKPTNDLSLDKVKKMSVADYKKIWNYYQYKGWVNSVSGTSYDGNCIKLVKYLGNESSITIPAFIGKTPVLGIERGALPAEVKYVSFEPRENRIELDCSFRFCTEMADENGNIILHLGDRILMCGYVGEERDILDIPEGVTEIHKRAFYKGSESFPHTGYQFRKVIMHEGLQIIEYESFYNCPKLEMVEFPASLKRIVAYPFNHCPNLKYIRVSEKAEDVSYLSVFSKENIIIKSSKGSAAEKFAEENNIPFEAE